MIGFETTPQKGLLINLRNDEPRCYYEIRLGNDNLYIELGDNKRGETHISTIGFSVGDAFEPLMTEKEWNEL